MCAILGTHRTNCSGGGGVLATFWQLWLECFSNVQLRPEQSLNCKVKTVDCGKLMLTKKESHGTQNLPKLGKYLGRSESRESKAKNKCWVFQIFPFADLKIIRTSKVKFTWAGGSMARGSAALLFLCIFWRRVRRRLVLWGGHRVFETVVTTINSKYKHKPVTSENMP